MNRLKSHAIALALGAMSFVALSGSASASLIFDRGLPTANLNNAAGAARSNVAWADVGTTTLMGDNITLANSTIIDTIRVWVVSGDDLTANTNFSLYFGSDVGAATVVTFTAAASAITSVAYADSTTYQGSGGGFINLWQVDFTGLALSVGAGTYAFGVGGTAADGLNTPFLHASNAGVAGSPQQGADGFIYGYTAAGLLDTGNGYPFNSAGAAWDKSSDIDVQVFGSVPEPSSVALLGIALLSLLALGYSRRHDVA
jgi:hypothetical protein